MARKKDNRRRIFVHEYIQDFNATRAYIAAGYSEEGAGQSASRLLKNTNIREQIARLLEDRCRELAITKDRVLRETALLAFANMEDYMRVQDGDAYVDLSKLSRSQAAAIQEITSEVYVDGYEGTGEERQPIRVKRTKLKLAEKRGALELLGKHLTLFHDRIEHTGLDGGPVEHTIRFGDGDKE